MSIFQRFTQHLTSQVMVIDPAVSPRFRYPNGVFATLTTTPEDVADRCYDVFRALHLTPGVAEREVAKLLIGARPLCLSVESSPGYAYEAGRERTDIGRMRVFAHYLVRMQLTHESNQQQLQAIREIHHARRLQIMPGCCEVCDRLAGRTWRVGDPPDLPVRGCLRQGGCRCSYVPVVD